MKQKKKLAVIVVSAAVVVLVGFGMQIGDWGLSAKASEQPIQVANPSAVAAYIKAGDELAEHPKTVEKLEKAIKQYEAALKLDPNNFEALWKIADAYVRIVDIKVDFLIVEKEENKEILKTLGQQALNYAEQAYEINPKSPAAITANLQAYAYVSASFGIVKAIFKGAAGHYKDLANELIEVDDKYRGGIAYRYLGRLYYMAPWPVGSAKKAKENYLKAVEISNERIEPRYWLGMIYLDDKKYDLAKKEFQFVLDNPPYISEEYWISVFKKDSRAELDLIAEKEKK